MTRCAIIRAQQAQVNLPCFHWAVTKLPARLKLLKSSRRTGSADVFTLGDNNVVDHQVVGMEFDDDVTVAFTMSAFTNECTRTIKVMGTHGEIGANMEKNLIEVKDFTTGNVTRIQLSDTISGHGGGDDGLMKNLLRAIRGEEECMTAATISLQSHMMAFAAEESRKNSTVVDLKAFTERYGA